MTYVGLDLHKRYLTACALDGAGQVVAEARRLPNALAAVREWWLRQHERPEVHPVHALASVA